MDRETLRRIVREKTKGKSCSNTLENKNLENRTPIDFGDVKQTHVKNVMPKPNATVLENENLENQTPVNPSDVKKTDVKSDANSQPGETNSTGSGGEIGQNVTVVTVVPDDSDIEVLGKSSADNLGKSFRTGNDKTTVTTVTNQSISSQNPVEFSPIQKEKTENGEGDGEESIKVDGDKIVVYAGPKGQKRKLEIYYGLIRTIEDNTRIIDLKVPRLPQFELVAKKPGETLKLTVTVDFAQAEGKTIYYIRDKREVVERLYSFRGDRHISKRLINDALDAWLAKVDPGKYIEWIDVREIVKKYPEWDEINEDPLGFFLSRTNEVVGNEKLKVAVLLSVVSSQLKRLFGIYRVHLVLTGSSGAGKSSTVKSVLKLFYEMGDGVSDWVVMNVTRMTKESLGYLDIGTLDGKVLFIEQLDNVEGVSYLREAMSEGRITTLVPVKTESGDIKTIQKVIPGQPSFITTNVTANVDHQIINRSIQLYLSPAEDEELKEKIIRSILLRKGIDNEDLARLKLVTYVWLKTRPSDPMFRDHIGSKVVELLKKFINFKNIYRATEITRNLVRATASLFGHDEVTESDVEFVMRYFKKDVILTTLELSERDLQLLKWLRDHGYIEPEGNETVRDVPTTEVAQFLKLSTVETKKVLDSLYDKGLVWKAYDGKKFTWAVSKYGVKVLEELEQEVGEKKEVNADFDVDEMTIAYIRSKLDGKGEVTDDELTKVLKVTVQATDPESQETWREVLQQLGVIEPAGDGKWKVRN